MGLWIIQECQRYFKEKGTDYSIIALLKLASTATQFKSMINPNDELFFSPGNMPEKIVSYCRKKGQPAPETPGEIIPCILESLALHYRLVIKELEAVTSKNFRQINIVGGGEQEPDFESVCCKFHESNGGSWSR